MLFLLLIILAVYLLYRHYDKQRYYWIEKGIVGPTPSFLFGNLWDLVDYYRPRSIVIRDWSKKYGKVYGIHEGQRKILVINDFNMMAEVLHKQFNNFHARATFSLQRKDEGPKTHIVEAKGARWKRLRALASIAFTNNGLKKVLPTVENSALLMIGFLKEKMADGPVEMLEFYQEYTMDVISKVAMGQKDVKMFHNEYLDIARGVFARPIDTPIMVLPCLFPVLSDLIVRLFDNFGEFFGIAYIKLYKDVVKAVNDRKKQRTTGRQTSEDFIDMFLDAEVEEDISVGGQTVSRTLLFDEVVSQCMIFLLAGFETTANSLSYTTHLIANHPDVQEKMRAEIESVCVDQTVSYDQLKELKYTECVIKESLRHYPLASFVVTRECQATTKIGEMEIEEGTMIQTDPWTMHMDPEIWGEDASQFRPERWLDESKPALAFQSFGGGQRICLGMKLAYMEEKVALVHLLRQFRFEQCDKTNPMELVGSFTVSPKGVYVRVVDRSE